MVHLNVHNTLIYVWYMYVFKFNNGSNSNSSSIIIATFIIISIIIEIVFITIAEIIFMTIPMMKCYNNRQVIHVFKLHHFADNISDDAQALPLSRSFRIVRCQDMLARTTDV